MNLRQILLHLPENVISFYYMVIYPGPMIVYLKLPRNYIFLAPLPHI